MMLTSDTIFSSKKNMNDIHCFFEHREIYGTLSVYLFFNLQYNADTFDNQYWIANDKKKKEKEKKHKRAFL